MARFAARRDAMLVATTVIEVGVDVPEATIMVIEHAERFGLAQLHQLRGRVGRGAARSTCLLLYKAPLGETAKARLEIMRETEDGFRIAEEDLRLRGEGDVLGTRQSGMPGFRIARLEVHGASARRRARRRASSSSRAIPTLTSRARRGAAACCSICSSATRRSGCCGRGERSRRLAGALAGRRLRLVRQSRRAWRAPSGWIMPGRHHELRRILRREIANLDHLARAADRRRSRWSGSACTA